MKVYSIIHVEREDKLKLLLSQSTHLNISESETERNCKTEEMDEVEMWPKHIKSETKNDTTNNYYKNKFSSPETSCPRKVGSWK